MKSLHNFVIKPILLEGFSFRILNYLDGREITCHIPLDPSFRVTDELEPK